MLSKYFYHNKTYCDVCNDLSQPPRCNCWVKKSHDPDFADGVRFTVVSAFFFFAIIILLLFFGVICTQPHR